ncbi:DUF362 domain-containing protein [Helicovermis profundi]|uniref:DUF362 domain-containing protein n=1 Tax=Helicovermis profundi TaxID=3065157 RepID=A0AAU9EUG7_9FIRM|nr:DUF362 domain-containing protein [Clostridia bacterium S502]
MNKVSIVKCKDYFYDDVKNSLVRSIKNIGGLNKYLNDGDKILLKVNLLMKKSPDKATTTHPIFVKALADILLENGYKVLIGDSPGGPFNEKSLSAIYEVSGFNKEYGFESEMLNWNFNEFEKECLSCKLSKKITTVDFLNDIDKVISVSKLKTHAMMKFTGAVKNMFGTIPGIKKAEYHFKMPDVNDFADMLVDVCINANPILSFMDGIVAMEGAGPSNGDPVKLGLVLASTSPYKLDRVAVEIINMNYKEVPTVRKSIERGFVSNDFNDIIIVGEKIDEVKYSNFKSPSIRSVSFLRDGTPVFIKKAVDRLLKPRPKFNHTICVGCEECFKACPPKAIIMKSKKPFVNLETCIRCYCCQELCPVGAVEAYRPWLLRKIVKI